MKSFILDIYPVQLEIRNTLCQYMGAEAMVSDITDILIACFETSLYGEVRTVRGCATELMHLHGVPMDAATKTMEAVTYYFQVMLTKAPGLFDTNTTYTYAHVGVADFMIQEKQFPQSDPAELTLQRFRDEVEQGLINGDWFSERIRQLIGLY